MIETPLTPLTGTTVHLIRGSLVVQATVVWGANGRCGLQFSSEISVKEWLAAPATAEQHRVDALVARVKAEVAASTVAPRAPVAPRPPRTHKQLIDDLGAVGRLMQDLEDDLASSDDTIVRHSAKLQNLDIAMQMIRAIAKELSPTDEGASNTAAALEDLRVACKQALGTDQLQ